MKYCLVSDVGDPAKKKDKHDNDGHLKHVSVSSWPHFRSVGCLFTRMSVLLKLDQDDSVKYDQQNKGNVKNAMKFATM